MLGKGGKLQSSWVRCPFCDKPVLVSGVIRVKDLGRLNEWLVQMLHESGHLSEHVDEMQPS